MSRVQLGLRLIGTAAQVNGHRIRTGQIWDAEYPRLTDALGQLRDSHLHIDDGMSITIHQMRAKARKMKRNVGLDLVIVDYLQLMQASRRAENRTTEMGMISRELKGLARDLDVPVVALSQLSRAPETRAEKRPQLSDLRDSGALEQDADVVIFLYRDEVYDPQSPDIGIAELIVSKQRNGPIGTAKVSYRPDLMRFANISERQELAG
jgi:replicative DNA helicase